MIRGSTLKVSVSLPRSVSPRDIEEAEMLFFQSGRRKIKKRSEDFCVSKDCIFVTLSQKETLKLKAGEMLCVQARVLLHSGSVLASKKLYTGVKDSLFEGVLKGGRK